MYHNIYKWNHNFPQIARESGFKFRETGTHNSIIDWRFIGCMEIEQIMRDSDFERLETSIPHITDAPLGPLLKNSILDPAVSKYFLLAQLAIQYLLFCKQFLDRSVTKMRNILMENDKEILKLQKICRKKDSELLQLHKKININKEQKMYPCTKCTKNFNCLEMLNVHMSRKHSDNTSVTHNSSPEDDTHLINSIKLELEIKQLKERLNDAEKKLLERKQNETLICSSCNELNKKELKHIGIQTNFEERKEQNDIEENFHQFLENQQNVFESWRNSENDKFQKEIKSMHKKLTESLEELKLYKIQELEKKSIFTSSPRSDGENTNEFWNSKFVELETLYKNNQKNMKETIEQLDEKYTLNMKKIEETLKTQDKPNIVFVPNSNPPVPRTRIIDNAAKNAEPRKNVLGDDKKLNFIGRSDTFDVPSLSESESSTSSSDSAPEDENLKSEKMFPKKNPDQNLDTKRDNLIEEILSKSVLKPSIGKSLVNKDGFTKGKDLKMLMPVPQIDKIKNVDLNDKKLKKKIPETSKRDIKKIFNFRMKELGINPKWKALNVKHFQNFSENMAEQRDLCRYKNKSFIIIRNKISKEVDKVVKDRLNKTKPSVIKSQSTKQNVKINLQPSKIKTFQTSSITGTPIIVKEKGPDKIPIVQPRNLKTVPEEQQLSPDENRVSSFLTSTPTKNTETSSSSFISSLAKSQQNLLLELPSTSKSSPINIFDLNQDSDVSEIPNDLLIKPKPIPKKRVIFDLDQKTTINLQKNDNLSDCDISSFTSDKS